MRFENYGILPEHERGIGDRYKKWLPVLEAELKRTRIVAAHAGTGKTTLALQYPERFVDFVSMPFKYCLPDEYDEDESESSKANPEHELNMDWPNNYFNAILVELNKSDKILLIPPDWMILFMLYKEEIPYLLCYPENSNDAKEAYRQRYLARGNSETFLKIFIDGWERFLSSFEEDSYGRKLILKPHQFLSDVIVELDEICR